MFSVMKCLQPTRLAVERGNRYHIFDQSHEQSPSHWRSGDGPRQWSRVFLDTRQSWCSLSIFDASFKFARASYLVSGEPWSTVRLEQRAVGGILCLLRSDWSLRWLDVCICTDAPEKGFTFAVREGCHELPSEVGRVSERTRFKRSSRSIRAKSRALRSIAAGVVLEC